MTAVEAATWCLVTGQSWDLWHRLTGLERQAFLTAYEQIHTSGR